MLCVDIRLIAVDLVGFVGRWWVTACFVCFAGVLVCRFGLIRWLFVSGLL